MADIHITTDDAVIGTLDADWVVSEDTGAFRNEFRLADDIDVVIGDDFRITARQFKTCLKMMREMAMEKYPEDFV